MCFNLPGAPRGLGKTGGLIPGINGELPEKNTAKTWKKIKTNPDVLKMVDCHKSVESVVVYTVGQEIDSDCIPFTHNLLESDIIGGSKRKGKEKCVANAAGFNRPKMQIKGGKNKSTGSNRKGKEKVCDDVVPLGYDANAEDEYESLNESEEEEEFDVEHSRAYKDRFWGEVLSGDEDIFEPIGKENDPKKVLYLTHGEQMGKDCGSDSGKSDELISPKPTSEEDNCNTNKNLEFNEIDMACPELVKGLKFGDVTTFREAVREANLIKGKNLHFVKNNKDKGTVSTNAKKTPTTNKKQAAGGARATTASAVDSRAKGVKTIAVSAINSRARGSKAFVASSTGVRTLTTPLTIYGGGGGANSERVVVPTLEKAIQRMHA
ncbi:hypothetical protein CFP56_009931 [Quercus suber]|uniref:Uncharacterized protein n=1 Tax=Quercus suber TaxID=58331 RepID=A0AAW0L0Y3_QUESU